MNHCVQFLPPVSSFSLPVHGNMKIPTKRSISGGLVGICSLNGPPLGRKIPTKRSISGGLVGICDLDDPPLGRKIPTKRSISCGLVGIRALNDPPLGRKIPTKRSISCGLVGIRALDGLTIPPETANLRILAVFPRRCGGQLSLLLLFK